MAARIWVIPDTSPAGASVTVVGTIVAGLDEYDYIRVDAALQGATGGTLDVYLQRLVKPGSWTDWLHFAQLANGASPVKYSVIGMHGLSTTITTSNLGTDTLPAVSLAAATFLGGHPGKSLRAVYVTGTGMTAGAAQSIIITGTRADR